MQTVKLSALEMCRVQLVTVSQLIFNAKDERSSEKRWTHITYRLSPLEYSFPERRKLNIFNHSLYTFLNMLFLFTWLLTQLWQEALVCWNNIIIQWEPSLYDAMDETTDSKPTHSQTPPCPQPASFPFLTGDQPGHKQKEPRHRKQEHQNLWHGSVIGHIRGNQKVPWPIGMQNSSCWCGIHCLFQEKMVNNLHPQ